MTFAVVGALFDPNALIIRSFSFNVDKCATSPHIAPMRSRTVPALSDASDVKCGH